MKISLFSGFREVTPQAPQAPEAEPRLFIGLSSRAPTGGITLFRLARVQVWHVAQALEQLAPCKRKVPLDLSILYPERTDVPGISSLTVVFLKD